MLPATANALNTAEQSVYNPNSLGQIRCTRKLLKLNSHYQQPTELFQNTKLSFKMQILPHPKGKLSVTYFNQIAVLLTELCSTQVAGVEVLTRREKIRIRRTE